MSIVDMIKEGNVDELDLLEYVTDNDIEIAIAAAESYLATEPILDIAAHDKDKRVRLAAVNNTNTGVETLRFLLNDTDNEIVEAAKKRLEDLK